MNISDKIPITIHIKSNKEIEEIKNMEIEKLKSKDPVIISFEGIDGSGKGVQSENLVNKLKEKGYKVLVADFPQYSDFFGKEIGNLLSGNFTRTADTLAPKDIALWFAVDRLKFFKSVDLTKYDVLVMNRSTYSNVGFQGTRVHPDDQNSFISWLKELEFNQLDIPIPHLTLFLNINEVISARNVALKGVRSYIGDKADVYEESKDMMSKAQSIYRKLADTEPNFVKLDCVNVKTDKMYSIEHIENLIWDKVKFLLPERKVK